MSLQKLEQKLGEERLMIEILLVTTEAKFLQRTPPAQKQWLKLARFRVKEARRLSALAESTLASR